MSAIGGSLSLYLGISVSMMFEVLEFLVDIMISLFSFCKMSHSVSDANVWLHKNQVENNLKIVFCVYFA